MNTKLFAVLLSMILSLCTNLFGQEWRPISGSRQANISGLAVINHQQKSTTILVVHDNKKPEQLHAAILTINGAEAPVLTPLKWVGDDIPLDLEAVTAVPGRSDDFIVLAAAGRAYYVKIDLKAASISTVRSFDLSPAVEKGDYEGFSLQKINKTLVAVWAERGDTKKPATIFWGKLNLNNGKFTDTGSDPFTVPYPLTNVRHVSDIKVDTSGGTFVTAASDPGNDGPFDSAFYYAGTFNPNSALE